MLGKNCKSPIIDEHVSHARFYFVDLLQKKIAGASE